jgi:quinol monooxygenase YgiN
MQMSVPDGGVVVRERRLNKATGKDDMVDITVTEDDICHGYEMSLDLGAKRRMGAMEQNASLAIYDRKSKSPYFDQWEVSADHLCSSDEEVRRQLKSREEVTAMQQQRQSLDAQEQASRVIANIATGSAQGGTQGPSQETPVEQGGV